MMKTPRIIAAASLMLFSFALMAQPQKGERPEPPKMPSPEEYAQKEADMMKQELGLTDKQYKKVYKLIKKDREYRKSQAEARLGNGMPQGGPGGMGGRGGFPGGGPGMGGGMPPQGGMGGQMPSQFEMGQGQRPEGRPDMGPKNDIVTEEYLEKQEQKLKKILTEDQYYRWRSKHPAENMELPPIDLKPIE